MPKCEFMIWMLWFMSMSMSMYMSMSMSRTINTALCLKSVFLVAPLAVKRSSTSLCFGYVPWCQCFYFEKFIGDLNLVFLYDSVSCYLCK